MRFIYNGVEEDKKRWKQYLKDYLKELDKGEELLVACMEAMGKYNSWEHSHDLWRIPSVPAGGMGIKARNAIIDKRKEFQKELEDLEKK